MSWKILIMIIVSGVEYNLKTLLYLVFNLNLADTWKSLNLWKTSQILFTDFFGDVDANSLECSLETSALYVFNCYTLCSLIHNISLGYTMYDVRKTCLQLTAIITLLSNKYFNLNFTFDKGGNIVCTTQGHDFTFWIRHLRFVSLTLKKPQTLVRREPATTDTKANSANRHWGQFSIMLLYHFLCIHCNLRLLSS